MKLTNQGAVPVYTISGSSTARPLPEWLARKRKRSLKQDSEYANRIELLQDFEFEEASNCIRVSEDGDWIMSTGTYKPQMHTHYLPHLSLSYARHTNALNETFILLSSDYSKSLHLQADRFLEFHTPGGCHYTTRIPRYGRDLKYDRRSAEALVPCVGVNENGLGEVYRLNLEVGRFMKGYEVDVGGDDFTSLGGGALQGGIHAGAVNTAAVGEDSHNLLAFGTSIGTVEFWDSRSRSRIGILSPPSNTTTTSFDSSRYEITALEFKRNGLTLAAGSSTGLVHLYDLRSPVPLLRKDQGYGYPIHTLTFLESSTSSSRVTATDKILSSDKRIIKIWDSTDGTPWTSIEPAVDLNSIAWCKDSGMLLTANEGRQQHSFFIPQLGPAPKWCSFLDNLVEELAEDANDPNAFNAGGAHKAGEIYDNFRFVAVPELRALHLEHLIGRTGLLKPMMHGYLVNQQLYEEARLISQPELWIERRQKSIQERIDKERESRIRGVKKVSVKVNKRLAERMLEREEKNERRKAKRAIAKTGEFADTATDADGLPTANGTTTAADHDMDADSASDAGDGETNVPNNKSTNILTDPRFSSLFADPDFEVDESSAAYRATHPVARRDAADPRRLTAVEAELMDDTHTRHPDSDDESNSDDDDSEAEDPSVRKNIRRGDNAEGNKIGMSAYRKSGHVSRDERDDAKHAARLQRRAERFGAGGAGGTNMVASSSRPDGLSRRGTEVKAQSFGGRAARLPSDDAGRRDSGSRSRVRETGVVGEKEITFAPSSGRGGDRDGGGGRGRGRPNKFGGGGGDRDGDEGGGRGSGRGRGRGRGGRGGGRGGGESRGGRGGRGGSTGRGRGDRRSASNNTIRNL